MQIALPARQPFSFHAIVHSHGWVQLAPFQYASEDVTLHYAMNLTSGKVVDVQIQPDSLGIQATTQHQLNEKETSELKEKLIWMFGLDQDLSAFYQRAAGEPKLQHVIHEGKGRILRCATVFEDVIKTILTTNTTWSGTIRMTNALVQHFGTLIDGKPAKRAFPSPESLAGLDEKDLRDNARTGYRSPYILELSRAVASGQIDLEALKTSQLDTPLLKKQLLHLKGIGNYAAASLLMLFGRYDYIPIDSWAVKVVSHEWFQGKPTGADEVNQAFENWGEWKGLAYWFWDWELFKESGKQ